jgi:hypothetical protein
MEPGVFRPRVATRILRDVARSDGHPAREPVVKPGGTVVGVDVGLAIAGVTTAEHTPLH